MKVTNRQKVDGLEIVVADACLPPIEILKLYAFLSSHSTWHRERGDEDLSAWHLALDFPVENTKHSEPFQEMSKLVGRLFPREKFSPYRAYCNLTKFGDQANAHRDCSERSADLTCLYYANPEWDKNWGGETLFYNKDGDTVAAINPKPGRIAIFRGAILHRNGVPCKAAPAARYSVAYKLRAEGKKNGSKK